MFLDEELEKKLKEGATPGGLLQTCFNRLPKPETCAPVVFLNTLRQIENSWKLFCKRHPDYRPDAIKSYFCDYIEAPQSIRDFMRW